ncbi:FMN-binding negative transcriptional regulator [Marinobacter sp. NFXS9]|uniref:FMN-binding negative transcriptional regulator n=1 Tax=Marinobacter sp. NFXS9 TaxID=2818433 RepID=UPI0032DFC299
MYTPKHFAETDFERLQAFIRSRGFGTLVTVGPDGPEANHMPLHLDASGRLQCHVARNNPVWEQIVESPNVLVVFQGPDAYISPNWYPTKQDTGKAVPTWNYQVVHAYGQATPIQDRDWLWTHLNHLTDLHEQGRPEPWSVRDAPADYLEKMMGAIVGLEITIDRLEGKTKASQNQPERNREGVKEGLANNGGEAALAMAREIP